MSHDVARYTEATGMTRLPDHPSLAELPGGVDASRRAVQGLLVHRDRTRAAGLAPDEVRLDEQHLRSTAEILGRAFELSGAPVAEPRPAADRVLTVCRHFALLHTAFLRADGRPARVRCGFGGYFFDDTRWYDHWITEWWDGGRWVRDDPQIDAAYRAELDLDFDPHDQPQGRFLDGCEAWLATRAGDLDADRFGIFEYWGAAFIAGNVLSDVACLAGVELLPWDDWGMRLDWGPLDPVPEVDAEVLDELARLVVAGEVTEVLARYEADDRLRVPPDIRTFVDGESLPATITL